MKIHKQFLIPAWCLAVAGAALAAPRAEVVASGLENPWGVSFLPDQRFIVTERTGRMRIVGVDGKVGAPLGGLPEIAVGGQGGLLDVLVDAGFADNRTVYFCYAEPERGCSPRLEGAWAALSS